MQSLGQVRVFLRASGLGNDPAFASRLIVQSAECIREFSPIAKHDTDKPCSRYSQMVGSVIAVCMQLIWSRLKAPTGFCRITRANETTMTYRAVNRGRRMESTAFETWRISRRNSSAACLLLVQPPRTAGYLSRILTKLRDSGQPTEFSAAIAPPAKHAAIIACPGNPRDYCRPISG